MALSFRDREKETRKFILPRLNTKNIKKFNISNANGENAHISKSFGTSWLHCPPEDTLKQPCVEKEQVLSAKSKGFQGVGGCLIGAVAETLVVSSLPQDSYRFLPGHGRELVEKISANFGGKGGENRTIISADDFENQLFPTQMKHIDRGMGITEVENPAPRLGSESNSGDLASLLFPKPQLDALFSNQVDVTSFREMIRDKRVNYCDKPTTRRVEAWLRAVKKVRDREGLITQTTDDSPETQQLLLDESNRHFEETQKENFKN